MSQSFIYLLSVTLCLLTFSIPYWVLVSQHCVVSYKYLFLLVWIDDCKWAWVARNTHPASLIKLMCVATWVPGSFDPVYSFGFVGVQLMLPSALAHLKNVDMASFFSKNLKNVLSPHYTFITYNALQKFFKRNFEAYPVLCAKLFRKLTNRFWD